MRTSLVVFVLCCCMIATTSFAIPDICDPGPCGPGQYKNGTECLTCPAGTYQTTINHSCVACATCSKFRHDDFQKVEECNATQNTKFECVPGRFMYSNDEHEGPQCKLCRVCLAGYRKVSECTGVTNTVCQPQPQVTDKVEGAFHQSTEASVRNHSETNNEPSLANSSTTPSVNGTWPTDMSDSNSTVSNVTDSNSNLLVKIIAPIAAFLGLLLCVAVIFVIVKYVRKNRKKSQETNENGADEGMLNGNATTGV